MMVVFARDASVFDVAAAMFALLLLLFLLLMCLPPLMWSSCIDSGASIPFF